MHTIMVESCEFEEGIIIMYLLVSNTVKVRENLLGYQFNILFGIKFKLITVIFTIPEVISLMLKNNGCCIMSKSNFSFKQKYSPLDPK